MRNDILLCLLLIVPNVASAIAVGTIDSVTVTSEGSFINFSSWSSGTWDAVTDTGMPITAFGESTSSFGSMLMDERLGPSGRELIFSGGRVDIDFSQLPEVPDTPIGTILLPARLRMFYESRDLETGELSRWTTGIASETLEERNWVESVATVEYSFDESRGPNLLAYGLRSLHVETVPSAVPEPGSIVVWSCGLMGMAAFGSWKQRRMKTPTR